MIMQGTDNLDIAAPKLYVLSLYQSGNEVFFFWQDQLLFRFKASLHIESREINDLLQSRAITDLLDIRETRHLGWTIVKTGDHSGLSREGYTLFTMAESPSAGEFSVPPELSAIWKPGHALADHGNARIYISRFNRPASSQ